MSKDTKSLNTHPISATENSSSTLFTLSPVCKKPIEMSFSAEKISVDGGLLLLREIEARNGLLQSITNCIREDRHIGYLKHSIWRLRFYVAPRPHALAIRLRKYVLYGILPIINKIGRAHV